MAGVAPLGAVAGAAAVLVWGASPAATLLAATDLPAVVVGMLRTMLAAAVVLPLALLARLPVPRDAGGWAELVVSAALGFVAAVVLASVGIARTSTAHAGLIFAMPPVFTGLFAFLLSRHWPRRAWWLGAAIALAGQAVLISARDLPGQPNPATLEGDLIMLSSVLFIAAGYVAGSRLGTRIGALPATAWSIVGGGALLLPTLPWWAGEVDWAAVGPVSLGGLGFLVFVVTLFGYAAWFWALSRDGAARIAPLQFAQPLVSLLIAVLLLGETLAPGVYLATALVLVGVVVCRASQR